ncbi:MAG: aldo/keto reductase [Salaquimonas sp.]|jgi:aryl-alcohol dehydrogenase-like predicted oxidoreductase|nr:aldo/keto reductase [Salaquimonas sp.]
MEQRRLGKDGPLVGTIGLGCMSFAGVYGQTDIAGAHRTLAKALELGVTHLDTALIYGDGLSEEMIGAFIKDHPGRFTIATKAGIVRGSPGRFDNSADYLREALEGSLKRLGVEHVELFYLHRRDQTIPIEDVMGTLVRFIEEGKIGGIGLSEVAPYTLERAAAVHPVRAVQNEYSLWTRLPELGMIQACKCLGTTFVPFSPLGRSMFGIEPPDLSTLGERDFRRNVPRFQEPHFSANLKKVAKLRDFAAERGWTMPALAIAWVLAKGEHLIPIPGTRSVEHLQQNAAGTEIGLTADDLEQIEAIAPAGFAHGARYNDAQRAGPEDYC